MSKRMTTYVVLAGGETHTFTRLDAVRAVFRGYSEPILVDRHRRTRTKSEATRITRMNTGYADHDEARIVSTAKHTFK